MKINHYLFFDGNCEEAFKWYAKIFGVDDLYAQRFGDMPGESPFPKDMDDKIMHVALSLEGGCLMGSDDPTGDYQKPGGMAISLNFDTVEEAREIFEKLSEGGTVKMNFEPTFFSPGFGVLEDKFGIPWMVNTMEPE